MTYFLQRWTGILCRILAILGVLAALPAAASHFRFGNLSWAPTGNPGEVEYRLTLAIRRDDAFNGLFPGGVDQYAETGDIVTNDLGAITFAFGDGQMTPTLPMVITAFSVTENWILGEALDPTTGQRGIRHRYLSEGPFLAGLDECCRLQATELNNRANGQYRLLSNVRPYTGNHSPICSLLPIMALPEGTAVTFAVPALDPDGDGLRFRLATDFESGGGAGPPNMSINPVSGVVTWNNQGLDTNGFWTAQVVVEDTTPPGGVKTATPVDFLLKINTSGNLAPVCTLSAGNTITVGAGTPIQFTVSATDADVADQLVLNTSGLPGGATMTPSLPVGGTSQGVASQFNWTPTVADIGSYQILFSAADSAGRQTLCSVNVSVISGGNQADLRLSKQAQATVVPPNGTAHFQLVAQNFGPSNALDVVVSDTLPAGMFAPVAVPGQGSCTVSGNVVRCFLGTMTAGQNVIIDLSAAVGGPGSLLNSARVDSSTPDPAPLNNQAIASIQVINRPPTVTITRPEPGSVFTLPPGQVPIETTASDPDGPVARVEFFANGTLVGVVSNAPFHLPWQATQVGGYVLTAVARDPYGASGTSAPVQITVRACDPVLSLDPMPDQVRCLCDEVTFTAVASSPDPVQYLWRRDGVILSGETNQTLLLRNLKPHDAGLYEVEASTGCALAVRSARLTLKGAGDLNPVSFTNAGRITIFDNNVATPYPAPILVECLPGPIRHLSVTLQGLSHNYPDDVDVLLAGPTGAAVRLMSDAGGGDNVTNLVLTFTDTVTNLLPNSTTLRNGIYAPTDYETPLETFPLPAPGPVTATNFVPFLGGAGNGTWSLFVRDDLGGDGGNIAGGWTLILEWDDAPPILDSAEYLADGTFRARLVGLPRMAHVVETSSDLETWTPVSTNTLNGPLLLTFPPGPGGTPHRFYRAVRCP